MSKEVTVFTTDVKKDCLSDFYLSEDSYIVEREDDFLVFKKRGENMVMYNLSCWMCYNTIRKNSEDDQHTCPVCGTPFATISNEA